jgi:hypothetical protein
MSSQHLGPGAGNLRRRSAVSWLFGSAGASCGRYQSKIADRTKYVQPVPERQSEFFEMLIG